MMHRLTIGMMLAALTVFGLPAMAQETPQQVEQTPEKVEEGTYPGTPNPEREAATDQQEETQQVKKAQAEEGQKPKEGFESGPGMKSTDRATAAIDARNGAHLGDALFSRFGDEVRVEVRLFNVKPGTYSVYLGQGCTVPSETQLESEQAKEAAFPMKIGEVKVDKTSMGALLYHTDKWTIAKYGHGTDVTGKSVILQPDKVDWEATVQQREKAGVSGPDVYQQKETTGEKTMEQKELQKSEQVMTEAMRGQSPLACGTVQQAIEAEGTM